MFSIKDTQIEGEVFVVRATWHRVTKHKKIAKYQPQISTNPLKTLRTLRKKKLQTNQKPLTIIIKTKQLKG